MTCKQQFLADESRTDRAQFMLAGAFLLVIILIGAVAVGNVAIASDTDRQRGTGDYAHEVEQAVTMADRSGSSALIHVNHNDSITSDTDRRNRAVIEALTAIEAVDRGLAFRGASLTASLRQMNGSDTVDGYRVVQNEDSEITAPDGGGGLQSDWTAVATADTTRQFSMTVDTESLTASSEPLTVVLDGEPVHLNAQTVSGATEVTLDTGTETCTVIANETVTVDFLAGTLNDKSCGTPPNTQTVSTVEIRNGTQASGSYSIVYLGDATDAGGPVTDTGSPPPANSTTIPLGHHAVYALTVDITVATEEASTTRTIVLAPGGIRDPLYPLR